MKGRPGVKKIKLTEGICVILSVRLRLPPFLEVFLWKFPCFETERFETNVLKLDV
jgi:hypothetical protein